MQGPCTPDGLELLQTVVARGNASCPARTGTAGGSTISVDYKGWYVCNLEPVFWLFKVVKSPTWQAPEYIRLRLLVPPALAVHGTSDTSQTSYQ